MEIAPHGRAMKCFGRPEFLVCLALLLAACGGTTASAGPTPSRIASPTPDPTTQNYVQLVHNYWVDLITADGNAPVVCLNGPINPTLCGARAPAMLVGVHEAPQK